MGLHLSRPSSSDFIPVKKASVMKSVSPRFFLFLGYPEMAPELSSHFHKTFIHLNLSMHLLEGETCMHVSDCACRCVSVTVKALCVCDFLPVIKVTSSPKLHQIPLDNIQNTVNILQTLRPPLCIHWAIGLLLSYIYR